MRKTIGKTDVDLMKIRDVLSELELIYANLTFVRIAIFEGSMSSDPRACDNALYIPERLLEGIIKRLNKELYEVMEEEG